MQSGTSGQERNNQPQPAEAVVVVRNWGPFAEKDAQKLLKTVGAPPVLTVPTPEADGQDGANSTPDKHKRYSARDNTNHSTDNVFLKR